MGVDAPVKGAAAPLPGPGRAGATATIVPVRTKIGYVYKASFAEAGVSKAYVGSTAQKLMRRLCKQHKRWDVLSLPDIEIEVHAVYARLDAAASGRGTLWSARSEALNAAEQRILLATKEAGIKTINDINAATYVHMEDWLKAYDVVAPGEITAGMVAEEKYLVRVQSKWLFKRPSLGGLSGAAFAGLDVLQAFLIWRDLEMSKYVMAPYLLEDDDGVFTLVHTENLVMSDEYWKRYNTGTKSGKDVSISAADFDYWKEEAHCLWGYADWKADFVPGILRRKLDVVFPNGA